MEKITRRSFLDKSSRIAAGILIPELPIQVTTPLDDYKKSLEPEIARFSPIVERIDIMRGIKSLTASQRLEDFQMYFPIYKAAEFSSQVNWLLLWIIHTHETATSRDTHPGRSGYVGAMQRHRGFYPDSEVRQASNNWNFLSNLNQRYHRGIGNIPFSSDYGEIIWAGQHISHKARQIYPQLPLEDGIQRVVRRNYSAEYFGNQRVNRYLEVRPVFEE